MRVYLAGPWIHRHAVAADAQRLLDLPREFSRAPLVLTEYWWLEEDRALTGAFLRQRALADYTGVVTADAVFVINSAKSEGKAVELGIAIGRGIPVFVIGSQNPSLNLFHYHPLVTCVNTIEEAHALLW